MLKSALFALLFSFVLLAVSAQRPVRSTPETEEQWGQFLQEYGRTYESQEEADQRYGVFLENLGHMENAKALNPKGIFGVTKFFDLTTEEFVQKYASNMTLEMAQEQLREMNVPLTHDVQSSDLGDDGVYPVGTSYPAVFGWRMQGFYVTPVKNQQQCGSCWAFSATELLESAWAIKTKDLLILSAQMTLDCSGAGSCGGGYLSQALQWYTQAQVTEGKNYPYTAMDSYCQFPQGSVPAKSAKLASFSQVAPSNAPDNMKAAISSTSPASFGIWGDMTILQSYQGGIIQNCGTVNNGGHAMVVTGYGSYGGAGIWHVRNSWGVDFGIQGYMMFDNTQNGCGINNMAYVATA